MVERLRTTDTASLGRFPHPWIELKYGIDDAGKLRMRGVKNYIRFVRIAVGSGALAIGLNENQAGLIAFMEHMGNGHQFFVTGNDVWLIEHVPPKYITLVADE